MIKMVKITPNCSMCTKLTKQVSITSCGTIISFYCQKKHIRIYGNPELSICNDIEQKIRGKDNEQNNKES